ncbi:hypothetical protein QYS49_07400 [Marivirga salinae]|uniref:Uncharacterized protein n=1 Tax=Marivirga salinarum TaxID=3059078 RepID=A0AA49JBX5_9BACT|nr:hypothetical protein [Marivirga sp. BDSF4-3]WKK77044.1 hypothetical protein QYS49_07400 [Marivirga sp. BDSF4-3]
MAVQIKKEIVNQKKYKITKSGTFYIDQKDIIKSDRFKQIVHRLKPVSKLKKG